MTFHVYPLLSSSPVELTSDLSLELSSNLAGQKESIITLSADEIANLATDPLNPTKSRIHIYVAMQGKLPESLDKQPALVVQVGTGLPKIITSGRGNQSSIDIFDKPDDDDSKKNVGVGIGIVSAEPYLSQNIYRFMINGVDSNNKSWKIKIKNRDLIDRSFTWVIASTSLEAQQPWANIIPEIINLDLLVGKPQGKEITIFNHGTKELSINGIVSKLDTGLKLESNPSFTATLQPNTSQKISLAFSSSSPDSKLNGKLEFNTTDQETSHPNSVSIVANVKALPKPWLHIIPSTITLDPLINQSKTQSITVFNKGNADLIVNNINLPGNLNITLKPPAKKITIPVNGSQKIDVTLQGSSNLLPVSFQSITFDTTDTDSTMALDHNKQVTVITQCKNIFLNQERTLNGRAAGAINAKFESLFEGAMNAIMQRGQITQEKLLPFQPYLKLFLQTIIDGCRQQALIWTRHSIQNIMVFLDSRGLAPSIYNKDLAQYVRANHGLSGELADAANIYLDLAILISQKIEHPWFDITPSFVGFGNLLTTKNQPQERVITVVNAGNKKLTINNFSIVPNFSHSSTNWQIRVIPLKSSDFPGMQTQFPLTLEPGTSRNIEVTLTVSNLLSIPADKSMSTTIIFDTTDIRAMTTPGHSRQVVATFLRSSKP